MKSPLPKEYSNTITLDHKRVADYGSNEGFHVNLSFVPVSGKYLQLKSTVHGLKLDKINALVKSCRFHASELTSYTSAPMV